ncbi:MAG: nucleotide exchange factor GrpE [Bacteroidota bacterium]
MTENQNSTSNEELENQAPIEDQASVSTEQSADDKYNELNDRFLRLYAEFDNYRKRTNKEKIDLISSAGEGVIKDFLVVLDDFERAIANNETAEDLTSVKEGFHLIFTKFKSTLETKGLKQMEAKGADFNGDFHVAIANVPAPSKNLKGKIIDDVEKGYYLNDKVIRYAKVVVGQ